ncbi:NUDIX domain-containing protein [Chromobacterium subtsugae]|uniref:NUDIX domain-containing protein n=1 Tax=Chromobacterium subtsugae TaxID=251747 RepID=A0ABS7FGP8_9NEIS|nr:MULTISPECIES: NUDIX domain-containing protein [Chromobacterium]KUM03970.1 hypothetical protein Cv017_16795 [Chromobacterium subtsugae]KZE86431.1 hypothetical protein AWB61_15635 [Chromobacterium sp. F49]MBW7567690.1 NUDIX domain-containing protein [Chromobacterium subtsugae]MBW8288916.1 NUDIX domain-containing protein [Chromobacterium subtsugae]WSE91291.1 NUDIX domain-containing protein [Chromobacterium subtsugae]
MDVAATSVLIFLRDDSQCWWQRRAWDDDSHPGRLDFAAGGGIEAGETPAAAAARELEEELGIADLPLRPLGRMKLDGEVCELFDAPLPARWRLGPEVAALLPLPLAALTALAADELHPQLADWLGRQEPAAHNC